MECTQCLDKCDQITDISSFRKISIGFTVLFGVANILAIMFVKTRNDQDREDITTTFNRRLTELYTNKFLLKTLIISILEFSILFTFAFWSYRYIVDELPIHVNLVGYTTSSY